MTHYAGRCHVAAEAALRAGWFLDVDRRASRAVAVTGWLPRPGAAPLLLNDASRSDGFGPLRVSARPEAGLPEGPGRPEARVVWVSGSALATVAASADGAGLWIEEYRSRTSCTLREAGLDGRDRRRPRPVGCGTRPVAETAAGLWVTVGPDAFVAATRATWPTDYVSVLLDPATLAERARYPRAEPFDENRIVVVPHGREPLEVRDPRTGDVTPVGRPASHGWPDPRVGELSPDGRYLHFTFGEPGNVPQVLDVWLLDLRNATWLRVPSMPAYAALKGTNVAWAPDGRLVLFGQYYQSTRESRQVLVTWRPGEPALGLLPYERPATNDTRFLAFTAVRGHEVRGSQLKYLTASRSPARPHRPTTSTSYQWNGVPTNPA